MFDALKSAFFTAFTEGDGYYCSILWCMNVIFIGSYLTYAILAIFGKSKYRWIGYLIAFILCAKIRGDYTSFVIGIMVADILTTFPQSKFLNKSAYIFILLGLAIGNLIPSACVPNFIHISIVYAVGNFLFLLGISYCENVRRFFEKEILCKVGRYSFPLILIHFPIMMSFSLGYLSN